MSGSQIAFLGPEGSYTEQALLRLVTPERTLPCFSIAEVFSLLEQGTVALGFVPLENSLQGPVSETLDLLYEHKGRISILGSTSIEIAHCFGVLPGSTAAGVQEIYSHEQALRQCGKFLRVNFPQARLCPMSSTGAAADHVMQSGLVNAAVIAGEETLSKRGLVVLAEDIADENENQTRFVLLAGPSAVPKDAPDFSIVSATASPQYVTSIVVDPGRDRQGLLFEILQVISITHRVNLLSIHSRPDHRGGFVFHVDLEGAAQDPTIAACLAELQSYCLTHTGSTPQIIVCGSYPQQRFQTFPIRSVGVIGGNGIMGQWFCRFFRMAGLSVLSCDPKDASTASLETVVAESDALILSIPMSATDSVLAELTPLLRPGQLILENCSIKGSCLPTLTASVPQTVEVLGIHTMFAGDVESIRGENILITRTELSGKKASAIEDLFYKYGANLTHISTEAHDHAVSFLQSLFHLSAVALAEVLRESFPSVATLEPFSTPNSRAMLHIMRRVVNQNEGLLADLQTLNGESIKTRNLFLEKLFSLVMALNQGDTRGLLESARLSKDFLASTE